MFKKLAAVLAAIVVALTAMSFTAFAEDPGSVTIVQTSTAAKDGDFTVEVRFEMNPGVESMACNIRFDYRVLKLKSVSDAGLMSGFYYTVNSNIAQLTWTGNGKDVDATGTLATITFTALDEPSDGSIVYSSVSASNSKGIAMMVNGNTAVMNFGAPLPPEPEPEVTTAAPEPEEITTESEEVEEYIDETTAPIVTEAPTTTTEPTTPAPTTTSATTTRRRSTTTTTERQTEPPTTTPEPTTEPPTTTTEPTTSAPPTDTTPPTTTEITTSDMLMLGVTSQPDEGEEFADAYTEDADNKTANRGTMLLALIAIALTGVLVVAIEMYRRRG